MQTLLKIGELAAQFDIANDTIRYYEKHGLVSPSARSESDYRLFDSHNQATLAFILHAKRIGFTLQKIKVLLQIEAQKAQFSCNDVKDLLKRKRANIQQQLEQLHHVEQMLTDLTNTCDGNHASAEACPILDGIETGTIHSH